MQEIAAAWQFPDYVSSTFAGLVDCMSDMSWHSDPSGVTLVTHAEQFLVSEDRADVLTTLRALNDAAELLAHVGIENPSEVMWDEPHSHHFTFVVSPTEYEETRARFASELSWSYHDVE